MHEIESVREPGSFVQLTAFIDSCLRLEASPGVLDHLLPVGRDTPVWLSFARLNMRQPALVLDLVIAAAVDVSGFRSVRVLIEPVDFFMVEKFFLSVLALVGLAAVDASAHVVILQPQVHDS